MKRPRVWERRLGGHGQMQEHTNFALWTRLGAAMRCLGRAAGVLGCVGTLGVTPAFARPPGPMLRLPLEDYDYQPLPASVLNTGASAITLHYVDGKHLLLTFSRRRLMARLPDDPPTDFDRNVDAVLLELPSGKVLARTSWRLHDAEQYLWPLADGSFLLRDRNRLLAISPLAMLSKGGDAFAEQAFVASSRRIAAVVVSPTEDLVTLETKDPHEAERSASPGTRAYAAAASANAGEAAAEGNGNPVQIDFFRVAAGGEPRAVHAGEIGSRNLVLLPVDATGLVTAIDQGRAHWAFDFHHHDGKVDELSPFDSTCRPIPMMVSRSEFIAFGCRGGQDRRAIGGFNLRGEEMWEQGFLESFTHPELAFAPVAGRFVLGRMVTGLPLDGGTPLTPSQITTESISVYQTESGRVLLTMDLTPVMMAGQNFALSPDGGQLAVVNNGAVEVYPLPEVTKKEREAVHLAATLVPARTEAPILLEAIRARHAESSPAAATVGSAAPTQSAKGGAREGVPVELVIGKPAAQAAAKAGAVAAEESAAAAPAAAAVGSTVVNGDPQEGEGGNRKPPTLYAPGEKPGSAGQKPAAESGAGEPPQ